MRFPKRLQTEWGWLAAVLLLVSLHFWFPRLEPGTAADSYSIGGEGKKAFFELVGERYGDASRNSTPLSSLVARLDPDATLCVLGPARYPSNAEWNELLAWVSRGGSLVFAARYNDPELEISALNLRINRNPKQDDEATDKDDKVEEKKEEDGATEVQKKKPKPDAMYAVQSTLEGVQGAGWQTQGSVRSEHGGRVLVEANHSVQAISRKHGEGTIVLAASDFIFSNQSLVWRDHINSVLAVRLLDIVNPTFEVIFDESLNDSGTPKIVSILLAPLLRPISVQLLIGLLVFAWWRSRRFGPLLPPSSQTRHNIVDHTDALGSLYYRTREGSGVLRSYLRQLVWELRIRHSKGREKRILRPLAAHMGKTVDEVGAEFRDAGAIAKSRHVERKVAAHHIRRLATLRKAAAEIGLTRTRDSRPTQKPAAPQSDS